MAKITPQAATSGLGPIPDAHPFCMMSDLRADIAECERHVMKVPGREIPA